MKIPLARLGTIAYVGIYLTAAILIVDWGVLPLVVNATGTVQVPDVTGLSESEALATLQRLGLDNSLKYRFEPKEFDHTVLYQSPEGGAVVKSGRVVRLVVSQNELLVSVPSVKLTTLRDGRVTLEAAGLRLGSIAEQPNGEFPPGIVIAQSIEEHTRVKSGSRVDLTISSALPRSAISVPSLIGMTLAKAKEAVVEAGLKLGKVKKIHRPELLPGTVTGQEPDSSVSVMPDHIVDLTVSSLESLN